MLAKGVGFLSLILFTVNRVHEYSNIAHGQWTFARVHLAITAHRTTTHRVVDACCGQLSELEKDHTLEGMEYASSDGFLPWKKGAEHGILFALAVAQPTLYYTISVLEIMGTDGVHTNPTVVGVAAARTVWKALDYTPAKNLDIHLETMVTNSWEAPEELPNFTTLLPQ